MTSAKYTTTTQVAIGNRCSEIQPAIPAASNPTMVPMIWSTPQMVDPVSSRTTGFVMAATAITHTAISAIQRPTSTGRGIDLRSGGTSGADPTPVHRKKKEKRRKGQPPFHG